MLSRITPFLLRNLKKRYIHATSKLLNVKEYTDTEEWVLHTPKYIKIGLSKSAVEQLGTLVFIDYTNEPGDILEKGDESVSIESVKAVAGVNIPFDCELLENNEVHLDDLDKLNENPECEENSWIIKVKKQE
jgi:glycine cleavage system H protein